MSVELAMTLSPARMFDTQAKSITGVVIETASQAPWVAAMFAASSVRASGLRGRSGAPPVFLQISLLPTAPTARTIVAIRAGGLPAAVGLIYEAFSSS